MYLAEKPMVDNPFLIGEWPWYIVGLELVLILHIAIIYLPFALKNRFSLEKNNIYSLINLFFKLLKNLLE